MLGLGRLALALVLVSIAPAGLNAQSNAQLFREKTISVLIGAGAGGGADVYARLLANYYGNDLPGRPSAVARNVPGAGGLELANQIYNVAPNDGTVIGTFLASTALEPLFGNKDAHFQTARFTWIGNMLDTDVTACVAGKPSGIRSWKDLKNRVTTFGASGPSSLTSVEARTIGLLLGLKTKIIQGYQGTRTSNLAMQRGELDATCGLYMSTILSQFMGQINRGDLFVWITSGKQRSKEFPDVPTIYELIHSPADKQLADLIFGQEVLARPFSAPPGLSSERADALRSGFMRVMKDQTFLGAAKRAGLAIHPMDGQQTQARFEAFYHLPKSVVDRAKALMRPE